MLITPDMYAGLEAFLNQYQLIPSGPRLRPSRLSRRAGEIHSAVTLDFRNTRFDRIVIGVTGFNGQLPNLDLVPKRKLLDLYILYAPI